MSKLIFISSPYSHKEKDLEHQRYLDVLKYTADIMLSGCFAFSPILHSHELSRLHKLPSDWEYWNSYCELMLQKCDSMNVLMLDGWEDSVGVNAEIKIAKRLLIPINYIKV